VATHQQALGEYGIDSLEHVRDHRVVHVLLPVLHHGHAQEALKDVKVRLVAQQQHGTLHGAAFVSVVRHNRRRRRVAVNRPIIVSSN